MNELVITNEQEVPVTTSLKVAEYFEKRHDHVAESIRMIIGIMEKESSGGTPDFRETPYVNEQNHQTYKMYEMTRKGFMLLVMGFTGAAAMKMTIPPNNNDF